AEGSSRFAGGSSPLARVAAVGRGVFSRILVDFQFVLLQGELSGVPAPVAGNVDWRFCHTCRHRVGLRRPGDLRSSIGTWIRLGAHYGLAWQSTESGWSAARGSDPHDSGADYPSLAGDHALEAQR